MDASATILCHWFEYHREDNQLIHISSEPLDESERIRQLTSFNGMPHDTYRKWFRRHRVKRKALPIYQEYRHHFFNALKDYYVQKRHFGAYGSGGFRAEKIVEGLMLFIFI